MSALDHRRFLFVTGKGGVGKSTVAAALATGMARRGRRVLMVASDQKERLSTLLGSAPLGPDLAEIAPGITGVRPEPARALREYGATILRNRLVTDAVFDSKYTRGFFAGVPGLSEWAVLGKAWFHATEELDDGRPRFDTVIFDAPATGHGLDMLRVPKILVEITPPGVLRRDAQAAWDMFRDPVRSGVVVVSLPEDMPTNETLELTAALRGELGLPLARLVINAVIPVAFSPAERAALAAVAPRLGAEAGEQALAVAARRGLRETIQAESLARLAPLDPQAIRLPRLLRDAANPAAVAELAAYF